MRLKIRHIDQCKAKHMAMTDDFLTLPCLENRFDYKKLTFNPCSTNFSAMEAPMPTLAPVTTAVFPYQRSIPTFLQ